MSNLRSFGFFAVLVLVACTNRDMDSEVLTDDVVAQEECPTGIVEWFPVIYESVEGATASSAEDACEAAIWETYGADHCNEGTQQTAEPGSTASLMTEICVERSNNECPVAANGTWLGCRVALRGTWFDEWSGAWVSDCELETQWQFDCIAEISGPEVDTPEAWEEWHRDHDR